MSVKSLFLIVGTICSKCYNTKAFLLKKIKYFEEHACLRHVSQVGNNCLENLFFFLVRITRAMQLESLEPHNCNSETPMLESLNQTYTILLPFLFLI